MKKVEVIRIADIPAQVIWDEMKHFDRVLRWVPGGNKSTISVKGQGIGAIRDIELVTQGYVQHELVAYNEKDYSFSYKLTNGKPVGMQDYKVIAKIIPIDKFNRKLTDVRISLIDKCNFRCTYCMPKSVFGDNYKFLANKDLYTR